MDSGDCCNGTVPSSSIGLAGNTHAIISVVHYTFCSSTSSSDFIAVIHLVNVGICADFPVRG